MYLIATGGNKIIHMHIVLSLVVTFLRLASVWTREHPYTSLCVYMPISKTPSPRRNHKHLFSPNREVVVAICSDRWVRLQPRMANRLTYGWMDLNSVITGRYKVTSVCCVKRLQKRHVSSSTIIFNRSLVFRRHIIRNTYIYIHSHQIALDRKV